MLLSPIRLCTIVLTLALAGVLHAQSAAAITDHTVQLPTGQVFYRDSGGDGIPVVFLHAGSGNSKLWEFQIPAFTAAGYRFIAIDYRGVSNVGSNNYPALIHELVLKLGLPKFHLVGTAAGGGTGLQYALAHPEQLRSITVANSIGNVQDKAYADMGARIRPPAFNQLPLELRELGPSYRAVNPAGVARWLELSGQEAAPTAAANNASSTNTLVTVTWDKLEKFGVPTLLTTGDADMYTPPSVLRLFKEHMPQAEFVIIQEAGHSAFWESPDEFNRAVLAFIAAH